MKTAWPRSWAGVGAALGGVALVCSSVATWTWYAPVRTMLPPSIGPQEPMESDKGSSAPATEAFVWRDVEGRRPLFPATVKDVGPDALYGGAKSLAAVGMAERMPMLVHVRLEAPPLRLVGRIGTAEAVRGIFVVTATGETVVAGEGRSFPGLGLIVERIALSSPVAPDPAGESVVEAWIRDVHSGRMRRMTTGTAAEAHGPVAAMRLEPGGETTEFRTGDAIASSGRSWRIRTIMAGESAVELEDETGRIVRVAAVPDADSAEHISRESN